MPTAWVTSGRDPHMLENLQADLLGRIRAFENGVPFIAANKCGVERNMVAYCGKSQIVSASGEVVALASQTDEELLSAQLELRTPAPYRSRVAQSAGAHVTTGTAVASSDRQLEPARRYRRAACGFSRMTLHLQHTATTISRPSPKPFRRYGSVRPRHSTPVCSWRIAWPDTVSRYWMRRLRIRGSSASLALALPSCACT